LLVISAPAITWVDGFVVSFCVRHGQLSREILRTVAQLLKNSAS
jgi:hypothetical protein